MYVKKNTAGIHWVHHGGPDSNTAPSRTMCPWLIYFVYRHEAIGAEWLTRGQNKLLNERLRHVV